MDKKLGNIKQIQSVYDIEFTSGKESGKKALLVNNGDIEMLISKDNALDILWLRYRGQNISFLSKNGINNNNRSFENNFEGGFLYTCGMDNISTCRKDYPIHGSLHNTKAENVNYQFLEKSIIIEGKICETALFKQNLVLNRQITVNCKGVRIIDTVANEAYIESGYCLLYHFNIGYPMLDSSMQININSNKIEGLTQKAQLNKDFASVIYEPTDNEAEEVFYHSLGKGEVMIYNPKLRTEMTLNYDVDKLPVFIQWKSMASGDYALGLEPATTRFDNFNLTKIKSLERHIYKLDIGFSSKGE